jgi:hypothetical protein
LETGRVRERSERGESERNRAGRSGWRGRYGQNERERIMVREE